MKERDWNLYYSYAKNYYEKYGDLFIKGRYEEIDSAGNIITLGDWIFRQREKYNTNKLSKDKIKKLEEIGMVWDCKDYYNECSFSKWYKWYLLLEKYYQEHGNINMLQSYKEKTSDGKIFNLGTWLYQQKIFYNENKLDDRRIKLLEKLSINWEKKTNYTWQQMYLIATRYYLEHGNLLVPVDYQYTLNDKVYSLGMWIHNQRNFYKKTGELSEERINDLEKIGMFWEAGSTSSCVSKSWLETYELLYEYCKNNKKRNFLNKNVFYIKKSDGTIVEISKWLYEQRTLYKNNKLNESKYMLLLNLGVDFENFNVDIPYKWYKNYELAKKYYETHENLIIPRSLVVKDKEGKSIRIGQWIGTQRRAYNHEDDNHIINDEQIKLLEEIGMVWENIIFSPKIESCISSSWMKKYELAKKYYKKYKTLDIPFKYTCNGVKLGSWINIQRGAYNKTNGCILNDKQIKLLEEIGMIWNKKDILIPSSWYEKYELAKKYYEKHGNLLPIKNCEIKDKNKKLVNIYNWINVQRKNYNKGLLLEEQIKLLEEIGMVWNLRDKYVKNEVQNTLENSFNYEDDNNLEINKNLLKK